MKFKDLFTMKRTERVFPVLNLLTFCGLIYALTLGVTWHWWLLSFLIYSLTMGFGISATYHRLLAHKSYSTNKFFLDKTLLTFEREIQFYISYLEYISIFKKEGLKFCYPDVSNTSKDIFCNETFDIALAQKLIKNKSTIVTNDFYLKNKERIIVVSGPNQSGKTTFARMFGQVHFLASIGCPIPGKEAKLFLYDKIFTIFEKKERIKDLRSKLEDDLLRIRDILNQASSNSIIIMNEIFTATTLKDALFLGEKIMEKLIKLDLLCVWVSFVYELASFSEQTVSMTGNIVPENPDLRTYKITRKPADGLAYALSIAKKHQLTYDELIKRIKV